MGVSSKQNMLESKEPATLQPLEGQDQLRSMQALRGALHPTVDRNLPVISRRIHLMNAWVRRARCHEALRQGEQVQKRPQTVGRTWARPRCGDVLRAATVAIGNAQGFWHRAAQAYPMHRVQDKGSFVRVLGSPRLRGTGNVACQIILAEV